MYTVRLCGMLLYSYVSYRISDPAVITKELYFATVCMCETFCLQKHGYIIRDSMLTLHARTYYQVLLHIHKFLTPSNAFELFSFNSFDSKTKYIRASLVAILFLCSSYSLMGDLTALHVVNVGWALFVTD